MVYNNNSATMIVLVAFILLLVACKSSIDPNLEGNVNLSFPEEASTQADYPVKPATPTPINEPYPAVDNRGVLIAIDKPVNSAAHEITGVGPTGLTIYAMNITFMGELLGEGVVDSNGRFSIPVDGLQTGIRIGITANLDDIGLSDKDIRYGEGVLSVPQVGFFFDTIVLNQ